MAESFLKYGAEALSGGERHQVVVHVDAATLQEGIAGRCELEHGPALPAETVQRLACDASVVTLVEDAKGEPLDIGRKSRSIPPAIRRALNARDRGCRFPGCSNNRYISDWTRLADTHREAALVIDSKTATSRWRGESMDYGTAVDVLLIRSRRAHDVSAETPC